MSYYHDEIEVLEEALVVYGPQAQIITCMEECGELIQSLSKHCRGLDHNVAEEIADVEIMLEQMKIHFRCHKDVNRWKAKKISRLLGRVEERKRALNHGTKKAMQ